ncbi:flippase [Parabacteroides sp.]|uniref:flippase n=1 Tax=Parabacteroides sp. TaxID=1869337 RepID=UPI00257C6C7F|nr:flippase [Parabacteroides sp.]
MNTDTSIKKNFAYKSILTLSSYLMNFITFPYVSRVLGVERIGLVNFVDNTVSYFLLFATLGINILGVREIAAVKGNLEERNQVFSNLLGMNLCFSLITLAVYLVCIMAIPQLRQYEELFYIGTSKIIFTAFLVEWFFTGIEHFRYITLRSIVIKSLYVVAVFVCIRSRDDYELYFIMTMAVVVINALVNMAYVRRFVSVKCQDLLSKRFYKKNLMLGVYSIMTSMYLTFNVMFLGFVSNNVEVGYYTTAFKLYSVILGFFSAFTNVMLPRMSALLSNGEKESFQRLANKSFYTMCIFCIPMIVCSIILAPQLVYVLSGEGYEGAVLPMRIIMPAALFVGMAQVLAVQILTPMKCDKILLVASIVGACVGLLLNLLLVPHIHSVGTAVVLLGSEIAVTASYIVYVIRYNIVQIPLDGVWFGMFLALICSVICISCNICIDNQFVQLAVATIGAGGVVLIIYQCWIKSI